MNVRTLFVEMFTKKCTITGGSEGGTSAITLFSVSSTLVATRKYHVDFHFRDRLLLLTKENTFKNELLNIRIDFHSDLMPEQDKPFFMRIVLQ